MLRTQRVRPHPPLRPFICSFVQLEASREPSETTEPVVARLGVMLNFKFAGSYEIRTHRGDIFVHPNPVSIVGPQTFRRVDLTRGGNVDFIVVMFEPCGFHALFGIPTSSVTDRSFEGHAVLGNKITQLYEQLGNLRTFSERTELLNSYFLHYLQKGKQLSPAHDALQHLTRFPQCSIFEIARQANLSQRQIERKALVYAGVSPKTFVRIARFNSALQLSRKRSLSWSEIAHETGYYDHMHLIRDCREFAGFVPSSVRQEIAPDHLINFSALVL